ncbi:MAG: glycosyltransferase family 4 protein [Prosthecobacter sp.]
MKEENLYSLQQTRVLFLCTGVGIFNRGIESFFREAFDGLRETPGLEATVCKGAGETKADEHVLWNLPRTGHLAYWLGRCIRRSAYVAEQLSSFPTAVRAIRKYRPHVIFYSDSNLGFLLHRWRRQIGVPYRLLFSNGGPCHPPFNRTDFVHQVAPQYLNEALSAGESCNKHFMLPYGIKVSAAPASDAKVKSSLRAKLGLPQERPIVLSVGWIARKHKRMDYVIEEMARLPEPRPFLQLLGAMDAHSHEVIALGREMLGEANFSARSVPYEEVADYYRASDLFTLASLQEGFGRVYLEALMHGLPVIAHRHPVMDYVLGMEGIFGDLQSPGTLALLIQQTLERPSSPGSELNRWHSVKERFSWPVLAQQYLKMFQNCAERPLDSVF